MQTENRPYVYHNAVEQIGKPVRHKKLKVSHLHKKNFHIHVQLKQDIITLAKP